MHDDAGVGSRPHRATREPTARASVSAERTAETFRDEKPHAKDARVKRRRREVRADDADDGDSGGWIGDVNRARWVPWETRWSRFVDDDDDEDDDDEGGDAKECAGDRDARYGGRR